MCVCVCVCVCVWNVIELLPVILQQGNRCSAVVKMLCYKSGGRGFDPSWCHWKFLWT